MSEVFPRKSYRLWLAVLLGGLFVVLAIMALSEVSGWELSLFETIYGASDSWRNFALFITQLGSAWVWLALIALLLIIRRRPGPALTMFRNGAIAYILVELIKQAVGRARPEQLIQDVVARETISLGLGFPSGHVAIATVMSLTLVSFYSGQWRFVLAPIWIGLVAWSRIYLGVHSPLDVLGGVVLGALIMLLVYYLPNKGIWRTN